VRVRKNKYGKIEWLDNEDYDTTTWQVGSLEHNLINLLRRISNESKQNLHQEEEKNSAGVPTVKSFYFAQIDDITHWINGNVEYQRIEEIARGLSLVRFPKETPESAFSNLPISTAYALTAIVHNRHIPVDNQNLILPRVPTLLEKLAAGDCYTATKLAANRLYASGLNPAIRDGIFEPSDRTRRIASSLAFPISRSTIVRLVKHIVKFDHQDSKD